MPSIMQHDAAFFACRDGMEIVPLDVVYSGWVHSPPFEGLLELNVTLVPPHATYCTWLRNKRHQLTMANKPVSPSQGASNAAAS